MSFYGSSFTYDGRSSEEFGLMLYDFNTTTQGSSNFASGMSIKEERIPYRYRSLFCGATFEDTLRFTLVFGADEYSALNQEDIDRHEMEVIGSWLTGKANYCWLSIDQEDMIGVRYRCIITNLKMIEFSGFKWAFQCTVNCDSPYGYTFPVIHRFVVNGELSSNILSKSSHNGYYYPNLELQLLEGGDFSIVNESDNQHEFKLSNYPIADFISINGENGVISSKAGINVYQYSNFKFPRLLRGDNILKIKGNGIVKYICEFPVNVGG